nr:tyrosine-type recombinase/integrase [Phyllobacterium sophorae]
MVGGFLVEHFGEQSISMATVSATSIRRFVLGKQGRRPATVAANGVIIGCYLRFRSMSGDRVNELKAAITRVAHWRLASLPEVLTDAEIDDLLSSFDQSFPSRLRAYAMVRCLIDLGLRSSEVVKVQLDDINWADGRSTLSAKSRRADALPLPLPPQRERRLRPIYTRSGPRHRTGPYWFAMLPPTTNRSRPRASNARCWPATEDVDGRGPVPTFSGTAWPVDFCAPARR